MLNNEGYAYAWLIPDNVHTHPEGVGHQEQPTTLHTKYIEQQRVESVDLNKQLQYYHDKRNLLLSSNKETNPWED